MNKFKLRSGLMFALLAGSLAGCSPSGKSPDVSNNIQKSLDQAGIKDVTVSQDRDKGIVTLKGRVPAEGEKMQAESIAKSIAGSQVVADEVQVAPPGVEHEARTIDSDLDKGIESNLDAALVGRKLRDSVKTDVKNGVVTLSGDVHSETTRHEAEQIAASVPNVRQVVNELQVKDQKASSSR